MMVASVHAFHFELAKLRSSSRWPDQEEFSYQVGMSLGGYRKLETGERVPEVETLQRILTKLDARPEVAAKMMRLRDDAKAVKVGIVTPLSLNSAVDPDALAKRIKGEVVFVLKQAGIDIKESTKGVIEKRVLMILKSRIGA